MTKCHHVQWKASRWTANGTFQDERTDVIFYKNSVWKGRALYFILYGMWNLPERWILFLTGQEREKRTGWQGGVDYAIVFGDGMSWRCSVLILLRAARQPDGAWPSATASGVMGERLSNNRSVVEHDFIGGRELKANHDLVCHSPHHILGWALDVLIPKTTLWVSTMRLAQKVIYFGQRLFWWALRNDNSILLSFVSLTPCGGMG